MTGKKIYTFKSRIKRSIGSVFRHRKFGDVKVLKVRKEYGGNGYMVTCTNKLFRTRRVVLVNRTEGEIAA